MKTGIVWFKTNLRIDDNEVLIRAIAENDWIIPVYCFDPRNFEKTNYGIRKSGVFRTQFLLESLIDLDKNLKKIGSSLLILNGLPEIEIPKLLQEYPAARVYSQKEIAPEELDVLQKVEDELRSHQSKIFSFECNNLIASDDLSFELNELADVFTNFRKKIEERLKIRPDFTIPKQIQSPKFEVQSLPSLDDLGFNSPKKDNRSVLQFKGGETEAKARLHHYFFESHAIARYKETRNEMVGADYSSKFSAYLSLGCISPKTIYWGLKQYESEHLSNDSTYWLFFELLWREYFRLTMRKYGALFFQKKGLKAQNSVEKAHNPILFEQWKNGETGNDFIDANMIELKLTGFMSNRGRQNVASFLCHDLGLDWRYGAAYFEHQLIDYDVCSNWCNWAYIAGVGNDPRPNRKFNTEKQANDYDGNKSFRDLWLKN